MTPRTVEPWLLLGERRRRMLEHRFRAAAERWAARWVSGTVTVSVAVEAAPQSATRQSDQRNTLRFVVRGKSGDCLAQFVVPHRLVAWSAGLGAVELSAIADLDDRSPFGQIELELVRGFWDQLIAQGQGEARALVGSSVECLDEQPADEALRALAERGVHVTCAFEPAPGLCIQATLSPTTVATLLAERRPELAGEHVVSRRAALSPAPVAVECWLGSVEVPVRDLHSLRVGDVLVTDIGLDGQAELRVQSRSRPIAAGTLGALEGRKAIKLAGVFTVNEGWHR